MGGLSSTSYMEHNEHSPEDLVLDQQTDAGDKEGAWDALNFNPRHIYRHRASRVVRIAV